MHEGIVQRVFEPEKADFWGELQYEKKLRMWYICFRGCDGLRTLDLSTFDLSAANYTEWMLDSWMPLLELHTPAM